MTVSEITKSDVANLLGTFTRQNEIADKLFRSMPVGPSEMRDRVEKILEAIRSCQSTFQGFVAHDGDRIIGAVSYWPVPVEYFAQLYTSCTDSWSRDPGECVTVRSLGSISAGAGSALLGAVERIAKTVSLPVLLRNTPESAGFYRKLGYQCRNGTCRKTFGLIESLLLESSR